MTPEEERKAAARQRVRDLGREIINRVWIREGCEGLERIRNTPIGEPLPPPLYQPEPDLEFDPSTDYDPDKDRGYDPDDDGE